MIRRPPGPPLFPSTPPSRSRYPPLCQDDLDAMARLGFNSIRLPISWSLLEPERGRFDSTYLDRAQARAGSTRSRSEEHTSELQSHLNLVCRLLLEKKKTPITFSKCTRWHSEQRPTHSP